VTFLIALVCLLAFFPALLYFRNTTLFRVPSARSDGPTPAVSVLIPARNEEAGIAACLDSILANQEVELEVVVLDDHSTDRTAEIVRGLAERDPRVRLESSSELPAGWSGKQYACFQLAQHARHEIITFLDADVRLAPDALSRMAGFLHSSGASLVSGFPRQETLTLLEQLIIPLINWLLLAYLPISRMRTSLQVGLGAGCGQWFMTTRTAYTTCGGHGHPRVKQSFHDGITLPRAYRQAGMMTDLCDATPFATCRMYRSAGQVWNGFAKNAREGLGAPGLIWIWTILLSLGQVVPFLLLPAIPFLPPWQGAVIGLAALATLAPRLHGLVAFRQPILGMVLHPLAIVLMLQIQWYATIRAWIGKPIGWRGRTQPVGTLS
jgi:glycosyltransferase involved in cell wall biosynthesis